MNYKPLLLNTWNCGNVASTLNVWFCKLWLSLAWYRALNLSSSNWKSYYCDCLLHTVYCCWDFYLRAHLRKVKSWGLNRMICFRFVDDISSKCHITLAWIWKTETQYSTMSLKIACKASWLLRFGRFGLRAQSRYPGRRTYGGLQLENVNNSARYQ